MKRMPLFVGALVLVLGGAGAVYFTSHKDTAHEAAAGASLATETRSADELLLAARHAFLGEGRAQSDADGAALVLKAAAAGDEKAIGFAGTLYMGGIGVEQNVSKAREWLSRSTDAEAQKLAEALLTFEAVLATMPEHQAELEKEMNRQQAHDSIRSSFIAALERQKLEEAQSIDTAPAAGDAQDDTAEAPATEETAADANGTGSSENAESTEDAAE